MYIIQKPSNDVNGGLHSLGSRQAVGFVRPALHLQGQFHSASSRPIPVGRLCGYYVLVSAIFYVAAGKPAAGIGRHRGNQFLDDHVGGVDAQLVVFLGAPLVVGKQPPILSPAGIHLLDFLFQFLSFIGRTDVEAETAILWPPDVKS